MRCVKAGWASVIRAFGQYKGGFGMHEARLASDPGSLDSCFDAWVTNDSIKRGAVDDPVLKLALDARRGLDWASLLASMTSTLPVSLPGVHALRAQANQNGYSERELVRLLNTISAAARIKPSGSELARGLIGKYNGFSPGDKFGASTLFEPIDVGSLPDEDSRGRDKRAVHGFFNRALTDHWCRELPKTLDKLRGKAADSAETAACTYLADRAYDGTVTGYEGLQAERRTLDGRKSSPVIRPICEILGLAKYAADTTPASLRPGYVPSPEFNADNGGPYDRSVPDVASRSVKNWCMRVPVLDLLGGDTPNAEDLVADLDDPEKVVVLAGLDLGDRQGTLLLRASDGSEFQMVAFDSWTDKKITFRVPEGRKHDAKDYHALVIRADGVQSTGRFIIRLRREQPRIIGVRITRGEEVFYEFPSGRFRPITPGEITLEINFAGDMDKLKQADVKLDTVAARGNWQSEKSWQGKIEVPDGDAYKALRGARRLFVQAHTRSGSFFQALGAGPDAPPVPDKTHRVVIDTIPPILEHVTVTAGGVAYDAEWSGGPDTASVRSFVDGAVTPPSRRLNVKTSRRLPQRGSAEIELHFSADLDKAPAATVGDAEVPLSGSQRVWRGTFDLERAFGTAPSARLEVSAEDRWGNHIDGNPATLATLSLPPKDPVAVWWLHDEDGGQVVDTGKGGVDAQHTIGERPPATVSASGGPLQKYSLPSPVRRDAHFHLSKAPLRACPELWDFEWDEYLPRTFIFPRPISFSQPLQRRTLAILPNRPPTGLPPAELRRWLQDDQARVRAEQDRNRATDGGFDAKAKANWERRNGIWDDFQRRADLASNAVQERQMAIDREIRIQQDAMALIGRKADDELNVLIHTPDGIGWQPKYPPGEVAARYQPSINELCPGIGVRMDTLLGAHKQAVAEIKRLLEDWWAWTEKEYALLQSEYDNAIDPPRVSVTVPRRAAAALPVAAQPRARIACRAGDWKGYRMIERTSGLLHDIILQEIGYVESDLPDGGCIADLTLRDFAVSYGSLPPDEAISVSRKPWSRVGKKPVKVDVGHGASDEGGSLDDVREKANALKATALSFDAVQAQIQEAIERNLAR